MVCPAREDGGPGPALWEQVALPGGVCLQAEDESHLSELGLSNLQHPVSLEQSCHCPPAEAGGELSRLGLNASTGNLLHPPFPLLPWTGSRASLGAKRVEGAPAPTCSMHPVLLWEQKVNFLVSKPWHVLGLCVGAVGPVNCAPGPEMRKT